MSTAAHVFTHPNMWDIWRAIKSSANLYMMIQAGYVAYRYSVAAKIAKLKNHHAATLPTHVWMISISYLLFIVGGSFSDAYTKFGQGGSLRSVLYGVATAMGIVALHKILSYEGRKYTKTTSYIYRKDLEDPKKQ